MQKGLGSGCKVHSQVFGSGVLVPVPLPLKRLGVEDAVKCRRVRSGCSTS